MKVIKVRELPPVSNACQQTLREVLGQPEFSMAHVVMDIGSTSLPHYHRTFTEWYIILDGSGILEIDGEFIDVGPGSIVQIDPGETHCMRNTSMYALTHYVLCVPPFKPDDVIIVPE